MKHNSRVPLVGLLPHSQNIPAMNPGGLLFGMQLCQAKAWIFRTSDSELELVLCADTSDDGRTDLDAVLERVWRTVRQEKFERIKLTVSDRSERPTLLCLVLERRKWRQSTGSLYDSDTHTTTSHWVRQRKSDRET